MKKLLFCRFITGIQIPVMIVSSIWSALVYLRRTIYGEHSAAIYAQKPILSILDKFHGSILIIFALGACFVRKQLLAKKKDAPKNYLILLLLNAAETTGYSLLASLASGSMIAISNVYFVVFILIYSFICLLYFKSISTQYDR